MTTSKTRRLEGARRALEELTGLPAVTLHFEGKEMAAAFDPDVREHERRSAAGAGAVTSRALLHGLWLLPSGFPVPTEAIPEQKRHRLRAAGHFAQEHGRSFERLYSPAGDVKAIAVAGSDTSRSVDHAIRFTPIVQRVVVADVTWQPSSTMLDLAHRWGVGVVTAREEGCAVLRHPAPAVLGVPAIYRWWLAELAYDR